jgi:PadR family transcriptional regulator PadR
MPSEPRITLPLLKVLDVMLAEPTQDHWGFELIKSTGLQSGTLYPLLARLETAGWLESRWETEQKRGRPRRRYYRLTGVGAEAAGRTFTELPQPAPRTPPPPPSSGLWTSHLSGFLWAVIGLVATTVASAELLEWCPPLQRLIIRRTAAGLPGAYRDRYLEEWQAELEALPNGAVTRPHRTANRRDDLGPPGSPPLHVGTVQPDRVGPAARVGDANVDRPPGRSSPARSSAPALRRRFPTRPSPRSAPAGQCVLRHPRDQAIGDRLGIPRRAGPSATFHAAIVGRATDRLSTQHDALATPTTSRHVNSGFSGGSQDLAMCGEEHGGSGRDRTGPRPTAGLHPRQWSNRVALRTEG